MAAAVGGRAGICITAVPRRTRDVAGPVHDGGAKDDEWQPRHSAQRVLAASGGSAEQHGGRVWWGACPCQCAACLATPVATVEPPEATASAAARVG